MAERTAGLIQFRVDGTTYRARGSFSYNTGQNKREIMEDVNGPHGIKETYQKSMIEGEGTFDASIDPSIFFNFVNVTVSLMLSSGRNFTMSNAVYCGDGKIESEDAKFDVKFESEERMVEA